MSSTTVPLKEFDGARTVEFSSTPDHVFLEAGGHCYGFDRGIFLHAVKTLLGLAFVVEEFPSGARLR